MIISKGTYLEVRDQIKTGDIVFYTADKSWTSRIVKFWTSSEYTHVGMAYWLGNRLFVIEAYPGTGVRIAPMSKRIPHKVFSMGFKWDSVAETYAMENMLKPYSFFEALKAGLGLSLSTRNGYICTEYVAGISECLGLSFNRNKMTPEDLYYFLLDKKNCINIV